MIAGMFIFSWFIIFLQNHHETIARPSHDVRRNVARRSLVINVLNFILQISCECLGNVQRMSPEYRATCVQSRAEFANDSCNNRVTVLRLSQICLNNPFGVTAM